MSDREHLFGLLLSVALPATDIAALNDAFCKLADELARLRAENERLKADADRLRWLIDTADPSWTVQMFENYETGEIRDVIDAAIAQGKP